MEDKQKHISDAICIAYDLSESDIAILAIGRFAANKLEVTTVLKGEKATDLYNKILDSEGKNAMKDYEEDNNVYHVDPKGNIDGLVEDIRHD